MRQEKRRKGKETRFTMDSGQMMDRELPPESAPYIHEELLKIEQSLSTLISTQELSKLLISL